MDVKLEGSIITLARCGDPSMRYTSELLRAEATQHLASATAAGRPRGRHRHLWESHRAVNNTR